MTPADRDGPDSQPPPPAGTRILISRDELAARCGALAAEISRDYAGKDLLLVCILKGSMPFFVDLARELTIPVRFDYVGASSYRDGTETAGRVELTADLKEPIGAQHVLLVDDIVDTGLTVSRIVETLAERRPASLRLAALLDKPERRCVPVEIHYRGFAIPNRFVVGYGLDHAQRFRNLPYVAVVEEG